MTDLSYNTDNILSNFPSCLRKHIEELCLGSKIGLSSVTLNDISVSKMRLIDEDILNNFHFIMKIPFAGKRLKWEIIFDPEDLSFPPDFDFNDDQFLAFPDYDTIKNNVTHLDNWDLKNPQALSLVLNQFLALYKKYQLEKFRMENIYSKLWDEYEMITTKENGIDPQNIEVSIDGNNTVFFISLAVDCSSLPEYIQPLDKCFGSFYNPGEDYAHLTLNIGRLDRNRSWASLQLSPRVQQILEHSKNLHIPELKKGTTLFEYVSAVSKLLEDRIKAVANHYKMKKVYITSIAAICSCSIVEYDSETFSKAVFIFDVDDYNCLVTVTLGNYDHN
ncbi:BRISC and BRCA1-A complex member 2 isoform X2 [Leptinotarsa decemlineata]|uniref:BRISC and BRCA1-A complex member 2 isoform X2 n=1 Tax=Leptinotarsa decemlineata TaxID=7539 RepID=UPI003D308227